jgi:DNA-binding PadR family transcriptional regulator
MLTDAELTILGLIAECPCQGDEIHLVVESRGLRDWLPVGSASLRYILSKLERQQMLICEERVYVITEAGRGVLQTAVADLLRRPAALGSGFELGLANLNVLKPYQVYQALEQHQNDLQKQLEAVEKLWANREDEAADERRALYTHSLTVMRSELDWLASFLADWQQRYPAVEREAGETNSGEPHDMPTQGHSHTPPIPAKQLQVVRPKRSEE